MRPAHWLTSLRISRDLKLEATPEQMAFVKAFAAAAKLAGQKSALQSLHEEDRADLSTLALPEVSFYPFLTSEKVLVNSPVDLFRSTELRPRHFSLVLRVKSRLRSLI